MNLFENVGSISVSAGIVCFAVYLAGMRRLERVRSFPSVTMFCTGMSLWQLGLALLGGLGAEVRLNVVYGVAFIFLSAITQIAMAVQRRTALGRRKLDAARPPQTQPRSTPARVGDSVV
jgi:hypothetical protein